MGKAVRYAVLLVLGGLACLVHAVLPFWFTHIGSRVVCVLHDEMVARRARP